MDPRFFPALCRCRSSEARRADLVEIWGTRNCRTLRRPPGEMTRGEGSAVILLSIDIIRYFITDVYGVAEFSGGAFFSLEVASPSRKRRGFRTKDSGVSHAANCESPSRRGSSNTCTTRAGHSWSLERRDRPLNYHPERAGRREERQGGGVISS